MLAAATYRACAQLGGARASDLPEWEDPADVFDDAAAGGEGGRAADPAERAAQIAAFIAATGGEAG